MERWLGALLGLLLITYGMGTVVLGLVGERVPAVITLVRREGGQRDDVQAGRYTYVVSYTFHLPDGRRVDGFTKKVGDGVYVKHPNTVTTVRYLRWLPAFNIMESETKLNLGQAVLVGAGVLLIWPSTRRGAPQRERGAR